MKYLLAGLLLLAVPALADDAGLPKLSDLRDGTCDYPAPALAAHAEGSTLLSFLGKADGSIDAVRVLISSGNADLDQAAVACLSRWHFDPSSPLSARVRGEKRFNMGWQIPSDGTKPLGRNIGIPHICVQDYPPTAVAARETGTVRVGFTITARGGVRDPTVVTSSGFADLDAAALTCVKYWRYHPALNDGKPIDVPWLADIKWELPEPIPPPVNPPKP